MNNGNKKIKVLFLTYPRIGLNRGGLQIQIEETAKSLRQSGVDVVFYDPWKNEIPDVDICHVFSIDGTLLYHVERAEKLNIPVITTPVINAFTNGVYRFLLKVQLSRHLPGMYSDLKRAQRILEKSDKILALNTEERVAITRAFGLASESVVVLPNGINQDFYHADATLFKAKYGISDFVLQVGSIDANKNQLNSIRALATLPYDFVIIGQPASSSNDYYLECRRAAANRKVIFTGQIAHDDPLLSSAFAAARLVLLPSFREVMPLTLYEAASCGCKLVVSKNIPVVENIQPFIRFCRPNDIEDIAAAIEAEMSVPYNPDLKRAARSLPSWIDVGNRLQHIYNSAIQLREEKS